MSYTTLWEIPDELWEKIQRILPGPIERVWAYLTDSDLRRRWLAAGPMEMKVGAPFELVWRNDELSDPPARCQQRNQQPQGSGDKGNEEDTLN